VICDTRSDADIVLVTLTSPTGDYDETIECISRSEMYSSIADKLFVFDSHDTPVGFFPGVYAQLRHYLFNTTRHRTGCFIQSFNEFIRYREPEETSIRYLFSFQGNMTSRVRKRLLSTNFGTKDVLVERTEPFWDRIGSPELIGFKKQYADTMANSKFVLCPRGIGTSSFRLFETMQTGRVPIILSDAWVPSAHIDWNSFSLRIRERDIHNLVDICARSNENWIAMALEARAIWEKWFSHLGLANLIATSILDIKRAKRLQEGLFRSIDWPIRRSLTSARRVAVRSITMASNYLR